MDVEINYCNSIDSAHLRLSDNKLNIRFAPNGTGKSTIARAIHFSLEENNKRIIELLPFKFRASNPNNFKPKVITSKELKSTLCFNEDYVNQFTFQPNELVSNSFDILIKTEAYRKTEQEIEKIISTIRTIFSNNNELDELLSSLQLLSSAFKITAALSLNKNATGVKALSSGNKIKNIPLGLEPFKNFITSNKSVEWIAWHNKGVQDFGPISNGCCPYCTTETIPLQNTIAKVSQEYDKSNIKNLINLIETIEKLGVYFSIQTRHELQKITTLKNGIGKEEEKFLIEIKSQIDEMITKLITLKELSGFHFENDKNVGITLSDMTINISNFSLLQSDDTKRIVRTLNSSLESLISQAGKLQGNLNQQQSKVDKLIIKHQIDINGFLKSAGYRYAVFITKGKKPCLQLKHLDHNEFVSGGSQHLSYGERNAFAIVLFMYECLSKNPTLIILDDPISSFDKNKKFAILEMLFRRDTKECLKGKTVLMLTHDVEPIIDTVKAVKRQFNNQVSAAYLKFRKGIITEQNIVESDIKSFAQICMSIINSGSDDIIKLVYLRRYYEIIDDLGDAYQVLSNLFHTRDVLIDTREPMDTNNTDYEMAEDKKSAGYSEIQSRISDFNYNVQLTRIKDKSILLSLYLQCDNGYEKLQILRIFKPVIDNSVLQKFINETYHVENEFVCQLDPKRFDLIPEYIINECDSLINPPLAANEDMVDISA